MRIVSDTIIKNLLKSLTSQEIIEFQKVLTNSLSKYNKDPALIPPRIVINRDDLSAVHLFMPCFSERAGVKTLAGSSEGFKGSVSIINETNGELLGVLNAMNLTAFRTALTSTIPLMRFFNKIEDQGITVFGNGLQAYWHVRLTLVLFSEYISRVQIVVRSKNDRSKELFDTLAGEFPHVKFILTNDSEDYELSSSSIIYGCIPSTTPSIKYSLLNKERPTYISIIGSYKPHMFEVDDEIVQAAQKNGKIIIDSYEHTLAEAGELIKNGITVKDVVEIGELENFKNEDLSSNGQLVLVKIVGLAIMDISVGTRILEIANHRDVGFDVDFS